MDYLTRVLYRVYNKIFGKDKKYINPLESLKDKIELNDFKGDDEKFNIVIFALNNLPTAIYHTLYDDYYNVCPCQFQINLGYCKDELLPIYKNLEGLDELLNIQDFRYFFIRVNIIRSKKKINHVNSIIIDIHRKYVLIFEPTGSLSYDPKVIEGILSKYSLEGFRYLLPEDIGFNTFSGLQRMDYFCQSYIYYTFLIILENDGVDPTCFQDLFANTICFETLELFWFDIYQKLKESGYKLDGIATTWKYPGSTWSSLFDVWSSFTRSRDNEKSCSDISDDFVVKEEDGITVVEKL